MSWSAVAVPVRLHRARAEEVGGRLGERGGVGVGKGGGVGGQGERERERSYADC